MRLFLGIAIALVIGGGHAISAEESPISEAQALPAIQGCWVKYIGPRREMDSYYTACFFESGQLQTSWMEPAEGGGIGISGAYRFADRRLEFETDSVSDAWIWDVTKASCSVLFASRDIFALHDCTNGVADIQFRRVP